MSRPSALDQNWEFSRDGSFMLTRGLDPRLIDRANGETAFLLPTTDKDAQLGRLRNLLGPDTGPEAVGSKSGNRLMGSKLVVFREFGSPASPTSRGYDLFDLEGIEIDSAPSRRIIDLPGECAPGDSMVQGLQEYEGRLTFLKTTE